MTFDTSTRAVKRSISDENLRKSIDSVCKDFGYVSLKNEQYQCIKEFMSGRDIFVNMPTGWGKSLIFQMVPFIEMRLATLLDNATSCRRKAILLVICPLVALMKDQVTQLQSRGISASYVVSDQDEQTLRKIEEGHYNLVYMSPESCLDNERWRSMLTSTVYSSSLLGVAVDEVHCVTQWGLSNSNRERTAFRKWYSRLNELRSLTHPSVPVMALTATATCNTKTKIYELLELRNPYEVMINPDRSNITYVVQKMVNVLSIADHFTSVCEDIKENGRKATRTIIYCQTIFQCSLLYKSLSERLGNDCYEGNDCLPQNRRIEMLHSQTPFSVKEHVMEQFGDSTGYLRILIATIAYGMGVNCKSVTRIIHFGPSKTIEAYIQESGRGGRDGEKCVAILLFNGITLRVANDEMKEYVRDTSLTCRRTALFRHFEGSPRCRPLGHNCCDNCAKSCKCKDGDCDVNLHLTVQETRHSYQKRRTITEEDKGKLHRKLCLMHKNILMTKSSSPSDHVGFPTSLMQFGKSQIQEIMENCTVLFTVSDIMEYVNVWQRKHAISVLNILHDVFGDISSDYSQTMSDSDSSREEDELEGPHDKEWQDVMDDSSFLSLINFSDCSVETTFEQCQEMEENIDIPVMVESILSSHMVVED